MDENRSDEAQPPSNHGCGQKIPESCSGTGWAVVGTVLSHSQIVIPPRHFLQNLVNLKSHLTSVGQFTRVKTNYNR